MAGRYNDCNVVVFVAWGLGDLAEFHRIQTWKLQKTPGCKRKKANSKLHPQGSEQEVSQRASIYRQNLCILYIYCITYDLYYIMTFAYIHMYIWSRPPAGYPPPPHGMVQVGVQGQGRGMPLLPHH